MNRNKMLLYCFLLVYFAVALIVVAQQGLPDGKRFYDYRNSHVALPIGAPTSGVGNTIGSITSDGTNAYILLSTGWNKLTLQTPTATPTATATATSTPTPTP